LIEQLRLKAVAQYDLLRQRGVDHKPAMARAARIAGVTARTLYRWRRRVAADKLSAV